MSAGSYVPGKVPSAPESLPSFLQSELMSIHKGFQSISEILRQKPLAVEPAKRSEGMLVYADGTNWNPGSGAGVYSYNGSGWVFLINGDIDGGAP